MSKKYISYLIAIFVVEQNISVLFIQLVNSEMSCIFLVGSKYCVKLHSIHFLIEIFEGGYKRGLSESG